MRFFVATVKDADREWDESYLAQHNRPLADYEAEFLAIVGRFNRTLRPGESARTYVRGQFCEDDE